jgi:hypothetical protein
VGRFYKGCGTSIWKANLMLLNWIGRLFHNLR